MDARFVVSRHAMSYLPAGSWWMRFLLPLFRCQSVPLPQQYGAGVRGFDFHICFDGGSRPRFCHGPVVFRGVSVRDVFAFLNKVGGCTAWVSLERGRGDGWKTRLFAALLCQIRRDFPSVRLEVSPLPLAPYPSGFLPVSLLPRLRARRFNPGVFEFARRGGRPLLVDFVQIR